MTKSIGLVKKEVKRQRENRDRLYIMTPVNDSRTKEKKRGIGYRNSDEEKEN